MRIGESKCAWRGTLIGVSPTARNCPKTGTHPVSVVEWGTITYTYMCSTHHKAYSAKQRRLELV